MATPRRGSIRTSIPNDVNVQHAIHDLNGASTALDVTGTSRCIILQVDGDAADGTVGVDQVAISHDGGSSWIADPTLLAIASNESTGTVVASGLLNAAGIEPAGTPLNKLAIFKSGPHLGPTLMRVSRLAAEGALGGIPWTTNAPAVGIIRIY